jgi:cytochrome P450/nitrite reductase/ring-hydroxylating ferredoxin subunit
VSGKLAAGTSMRIRAFSGGQRLFAEAATTSGPREQGSDVRPETFVCFAKLSDLKGKGPFALSAAGVDVVLARTSGGWRAFSGRCPHQGALLGEGDIDGDALVCRNHRWRYSLDSGQRDGGPECLTSYPIVERDGSMFVDVASLHPAAARIAATRSLDDLPGPKRLPLIGNLHQFDPPKSHLLLEEWAARYGSTYQFWMGGRRAIATTDPALIDDILRGRPEIFRRTTNFGRILTDLGIRGVFNAEGNAWRAQRKLSVAALAQRNVHRLSPNIQLVTERLKMRWEKSASAGETLDVVEELKRFAVDVTSLIVFGHDANTVQRGDSFIPNELEVILPAINRRIFSLFPTWRYFETRSDKRLNRALINVRAWLGELLNRARALLESQPERTHKPSNFVEAMVAATDENGEPFSNDVIMSNLLTMLIAGEDTTAFTLSWAIHHLCDSPDWAAEVRSEADEVLGDSGVARDHDDIGRLVRAGAVANESMRMRPVVPISFHDANVDTTLGSYFVPQGTMVGPIMRPAALDPANFADPLAFRPERWLSDSIRPHNVSACWPFGSGPRMCPGRSLALLEMKSLLAMLYKNFDVERVGRSADVSELFGGFTMSPAGLRVRLHSRYQARSRP